MDEVGVQIGIGAVAVISLLLHLQNWTATNRATRRRNTIDFLNASRSAFVRGKDYCRLLIERVRSERRNRLVSGGLPREFVNHDRFLDLARAGIPLEARKATHERLNRELRDPEFEVVSDEYSRLCNFLNLIEEMANGVNTRIFDFQVLNKMYGGLILSYYSRLAFFVRRVRRQGGRGHSFRTYDQMEILVDRLLQYQGAGFKMYRFGSAVRILMSGPEYWPLLFRRFDQLDELTAELARRDLLDGATRITQASMHEDIEFRVVAGAARNSTKVRKQLTELFLQVLHETGGKWPVFVQSTADIGSSMEAWVETRMCSADVLHLAYKRQVIGSQLIGAIALKTLRRDDAQDHKHWNGDVLGAISDIDDEGSKRQSYLRSIGMPIDDLSGESDENHWVFNPDRVAILHSLGVAPAWRRKCVGRRLLRHAISYSHLQLRRCVLLNVIADEPAMRPAIALYDSEGGEFIGAHQDWGRDDFHRMYMYLF